MPQHLRRGGLRRKRQQRRLRRPRQQQAGEAGPRADGPAWKQRRVSVDCAEAGGRTAAEGKALLGLQILTVPNIQAHVSKWAVASKKLEQFDSCGTLSTCACCCVQSLLRLKRQKDGAARFAVTHIPAVAGHVPPYKAWAFLLNNERAVQTGRQMFYIDASGGLFHRTRGRLA